MLQGNGMVDAVQVVQKIMKKKIIINQQVDSSTTYRCHHRASSSSNLLQDLQTRLTPKIKSFSLQYSKMYWKISGGRDRITPGIYDPVPCEV